MFWSRRVPNWLAPIHLIVGVGSRSAALMRSRSRQVDASASLTWRRAGGCAFNTPQASPSAVSERGFRRECLEIRRRRRWQKKSARWEVALEKRSAVKWKKKKTRGETRRETINEEISEALDPAEFWKGLHQNYSRLQVPGCWRRGRHGNPVACCW